jgi:predicted phosphohydrolase
MSLFVIADLHLAGKEGDRKSMDVFGRRWIGGKEKLIRNWNAIVTDADSVVIPGDFSWAMTLSEAREDFALIDSLPGRKYIGKGNHDFWWTTMSKMNAYFKECGFTSLNILYNNSYEVDGGVICGSRGWFSEESNQKTVGDVDWQKIINREAMRLDISLSSVRADNSLPKYVFLHFPPVWNGIECSEIIDVLKKHCVTNCYFGHIHGVYSSDANFIYKGINFKIISADYLDFCPHKII